MEKPMHQPRRRSRLRLTLGRAFYAALRRVRRRHFAPYAAQRQAARLQEVHLRHETPLLRRLQGLDMELQHNKVTNLRLACARIDGLLLRPGETFSYWGCIGSPSARRGYLPGMVLRNGHVTAGVGGGLCQLSNLIYWMTLHTPLRVIERHHHGYDVFPDAGRTQPFGSGATCFHPYGDLMIRNDTQQTFQLCVAVGEKTLAGQWRADGPPEERYEVVEKNHAIRGEYWGGFTRHNELWRNVYDREGHFLREEYLTENHVMMMYEPLLEQTVQREGSGEGRGKDRA